MTTRALDAAFAAIAWPTAPPPLDVSCQRRAFYLGAVCQAGLVRVALHAGQTPPHPESAVMTAKVREVLARFELNDDALIALAELGAAEMTLIFMRGDRTEMSLAMEQLHAVVPEMMVRQPPPTEET